MGRISLKHEVQKDDRPGSLCRRMALSYGMCSTLLNSPEVLGEPPNTTDTGADWVSGDDRETFAMRIDTSSFKLDGPKFGVVQK